MPKDAWAQRLSQAKAMKDNIKRDIAELGKQLDGLLDRIAGSDSPTVISAYEKKITKLDLDKLILIDKLAQKTQPKHTLEEIFELSMEITSSH